eukprot:4864090-Prymnesium_polylepis.1
MKTDHDSRRDGPLASHATPFRAVSRVSTGDSRPVVPRPGAPGLSRRARTRYSDFPRPSRSLVSRRPCSMAAHHKWGGRVIQWKWGMTSHD